VDLTEYGFRTIEARAPAVAGGFPER
jgi:hypothetical protein